MCKDVAGMPTVNEKASVQSENSARATPHTEALVSMATAVYSRSPSSRLAVPPTVLLRSLIAPIHLVATHAFHISV